MDRERGDDPGDITSTDRLSQIRADGQRAGFAHQWRIRKFRFHSRPSLVSRVVIKMLCCTDIFLPPVTKP